LLVKPTVSLRLADIGHAAIATIERQEWLAPLEEVLQRGVARALRLAGRTTRNLLHGTWLGHPLHPVLTDLPIGAWTMGVCFDALDARDHRGRYARAADASIVVGVGGAVAAAAAGLADWHHTTGASRRTGFVHALFNTSALGLFIGSLVLRRQGRRDAGRALSATGYAVMLAAAYLGGSLVFRDRIGVDHSRRKVAGGQEVVLDVTGLGEGERQRVDVDDVPVMLVRDGGHVYALAERCSHLGGPLSEGTIENGAVVCPWHGSRFCLVDGRVLDGPATVEQPCYQVREFGGRLAIRPAA
jgi:nitrite reductase/ring-hydroxylating ferredoxin subunit/uncharacterized membrane protein